MAIAWDDTSDGWRTRFATKALKVMAGKGLPMASYTVARIKEYADTVTAGEKPDTFTEDERLVLASLFNQSSETVVLRKSASRSSAPPKSSSESEATPVTGPPPVDGEQKKRPDASAEGTGGVGPVAVPSLRPAEPKGDEAIRPEWSEEPDTLERIEADLERVEKLAHATLVHAEARARNEQARSIASRPSPRPAIQNPKPKSAPMRQGGPVAYPKDLRRAASMPPERGPGSVPMPASIFAPLCAALLLGTVPVTLKALAMVLSAPMLLAVTAPLTLTMIMLLYGIGMALVVIAVAEWVTLPDGEPTERVAAGTGA